MSYGPGIASRHWRNQRLTAIALIPLGLWFLVSLFGQPSLGHAAVASWLGAPSRALLAALFGGALLWHSMQGIRVVLEDYVGGRLRGASIALARLAHLAAALALAYAIWELATGASA